ncbi:unnamed protein product [Caenorhabditis auriculariae]|uniref:Uncharacterized protein n=1 Tax=Caenorhabditis auriculariae TaxID=2777116 RepID=A0A8S1HI40_9PELO|nr:unnamed protein product [Caenorhabditis auriculariae]
MPSSVLGVVVVVGFLFLHSESRSSSPYKAPAGLPVVLIPGDGGSQLEANLTGKPTTVHYVCSKQTPDFFDLWLNLELFTPLVIDCWVDNMQFVFFCLMNLEIMFVFRMMFNMTTGESTNMPGVDIRVTGFGDTPEIEWLDPSKASSGRYFFDLVDMMSSWGYTRGKNVVGAPYDWRKSPNELSDYFVTLKKLIEDTYRYNDNQKVVLVAHSMGNPVTLYFMRNFVDQPWKDKFIASLVSLAPPWGGSMQIVKLFASGYNMNYYRVILPPSHLRAMQRSFTSSAFLFPSSHVWGADEVFATTETTNYTVSNVEQFFTDLDYKLGWEQYKRAANLNGDLSAPGVPVHCIYGTGVDTPEKLTWPKGYFPDYQPIQINGDGDGTVNKRSAAVCARWKNANAGHRVTVHEVFKAEHMAIMRDPTALELVRKAIYQQL